ncbi:hypothetical protein EER87_20635 [Salmonella enterica subsp. enterica serovar Mbandaka]|nr:hypothetical protein [Salmonella enterica subsp. enterica serovar Mbandaka]
MIKLLKSQFLDSTWFISDIEIDSDFLSPGFVNKDEKSIDRYMDGFITFKCRLDQNTDEDKQARLVLYWECDSYVDGSFNTHIAFNETVLIEQVNFINELGESITLSPLEIIKIIESNIDKFKFSGFESWDVYICSKF